MSETIAGGGTRDGALAALRLRQRCAASYRDEHGGGVVRRHADAEAVADEPGDDRQPDGRYHVPAAAARERLALVRACSQVSVGVLRECVST